MDLSVLRNRLIPAVLLLCGCLVNSGCRIIAPRPSHVKDPLWPAHEAPRELNKVILPVYTIEPPDVLAIDAINIVPKAPYRFRTLDTVMLRVKHTLPDAPIDGVFPVESGGIVQLGPPYGSVKIAGLTVDDAKTVVEQHLRVYLSDPVVTLSLGEIAGKQQITGEHLVGPDGTVTLGSYGSVSVVGRTVGEAKAAVEAHLSQFLEDPEVSVVVFAYNSKVYYVITQGAGFGDGLVRVPIMGNETVMDAMSEINGTTAMSSARIWVARPGKNAAGCDQILPVDWLGITQRGDVATNYQLLPGDRVYVAADKLVAFDRSLEKVIAPLERIMGFTLLGTGTVTRLSDKVLEGGGARNASRGGF